LIGAAAVTLSTSYAFGDVFNARHSLHWSWDRAKVFYAIFAGIVALAATLVLIPQMPLGLVTLGVQALAGILLPSACVFLLLLANDRAVLGPWVNPGWLNLVASVIVGVLVMLSFILGAVTLFPSVNVPVLAAVTGSAVMVGLVGLAVVQFAGRRRSVRDGIPEVVEIDRMLWQMPPLETLTRPVWSTARKAGMLALRGYLVVAVVLIVAKLVQLALGGGVHA